MDPILFSHVLVQYSNEQSNTDILIDRLFEYRTIWNPNFKKFSIQTVGIQIPKCLPLSFQFRTWRARIWTVLHVLVGDVRRVRERRVLHSNDWTRKGDAKQQPPEIERINVFKEQYALG